MISLCDCQFQKLTLRNALQGAEDFRAAKKQRVEKPSTTKPAKRGPGVAFGTGVMDEDDVYGMTDDYIIEPDAKEGYDFDLQSDDEDRNQKR